MILYYKISIILVLVPFSPPLWPCCALGAAAAEPRPPRPAPHLYTHVHKHIHIHINTVYIYINIYTYIHLYTYIYWGLTRGCAVDGERVSACTSQENLIQRARWPFLLFAKSSEVRMYICMYICIIYIYIYTHIIIRRRRRTIRKTTADRCTSKRRRQTDLVTATTVCHSHHHYHRYRRPCRDCYRCCEPEMRESSAAVMIAIYLSTLIMFAIYLIYSDHASF